MRTIWRGTLAAAIVAVVSTTGFGAAGETRFTIATGGVTATYHAIGSSICRFVNKNRQRHGIRCRASPAEGSVSNLQRLRAGEIDMAIVQSDWQHHAYLGTSVFADAGPHKELRALFSVLPEPFTVVVGGNSPIRAVSDLRGRRVNLGRPGSGGRATINVVLEAAGLTLADFGETSEVKSSLAARQLCQGRFDAMLLVVAHPTLAVREATATCDAVIVPATSPVIQGLVKENDFFVSSVVPGGLYEANPVDVPTFGVTATVVTTTALPNNVVYEAVRATFESLSKFRELHPAFRRLDRRFMRGDHHTAPLHPGATRYFREAGLM